MVMITTLLTVACTFGVVAGFHAPLPSVVVRRRHTVVLRMAAAASSLPAVPVILHPDEYIDMKEALSAPLEVMLHSKRFAGLRYHAKEVPARLKVFFPKIVALFHPVDLAILGVSLLSYRHVLRFFYTVVGKFSKSSDTPVPYEQSLFARLQEPIFAAINLIPFVYVVDIIAIALHTFGFEFHIKGDLPRLLVTIYESFVVGTFIIQIKDWFLQKRRARALLARADTNATSTATSGRKARDTLRERVVDELSTLAVWGAMGGLCLEAMSLEMGFALGSVFALGGLGSASAVLAMRDTMENVIGGLLLKFSDKLRIGELVTIPGSGKAGGKVEEGVVEDISYVATTLRHEDNSVVVVPNQVFSKVEVVNWSRTPFRHFKTSVSIKINDFSQLEQIISNLKAEISRVAGVETVERDLIVSATGFKSDAVNLDIQAHLRVSEDDEGGSRIKTAVVSAIARSIAADSASLK